MESSSIKKIILENQVRIPGLDVIKRAYDLDSEVNYIFTGQRRAGKTWFMFSIIQHFLQQGHSVEEILYINFEDERLIGLEITQMDSILGSYHELFSHRPLLFFDELQNIVGWQKFARRLSDSGYRVYITGSNSTMLSSEMASTLGGRFLVKEIETLTFSEFLTFNERSLSPNFEYSDERFEVFRLFESYFNQGGFPELVRLRDKKEYLSTIFQKVFLGDIIARNQIRNTFALKLLIKKLAESTMDEVSFTRIRNIIASTGLQIGTATVIEYERYLEEAFLIASLPDFGSGISNRESKMKYYFRDHGLLSLFLVNPESFVLETMVYNNLRRWFAPNLFYLRDITEVDFYIPGKLLIQAAWRLDNETTRRRGVASLIKAADKYPAEKLLIITYDQEEKILVDNRMIHLLPAWKWMLTNTAED